MQSKWRVVSSVTASKVNKSARGCNLAYRFIKNAESVRASCHVNVCLIYPNPCLAPCPALIPTRPWGHVLPARQSVFCRHIHRRVRCILWRFFHRCKSPWFVYSGFFWGKGRLLVINDEWYHCGDSFAEGVAFVHIGLYIRAVEPARPR